jgi:hypothetical protein
LLRDMPSRLRHILSARAQILDAADETPYETLAQKLAVTEEQMIDLRLAGDLTIAAFFAADKPKDRESRRKELAEKFRSAQERVTDRELEDELQGAVRVLKAGSKGVTPFHWELEFPEVFRLNDRDEMTAGFDAFVGNPPFAGKNTMIAAHATSYLDWLKIVHEESHGNSDLVAHFFRRSFTLLRPRGCFGLIATNTIGQGDTRSTGLRWICTHNGVIYNAFKRRKWPGQAAVIVSVVHVAKGEIGGPYLLDGREVPIITAYLFHGGGHESAISLKANAEKSFVGVYALGMGFTFDDTDTKHLANTLKEMEALIAENPRNKQRIFPYIGGEEINDSPTHEHRRYIINFEDFPLKREQLASTWHQADEKQRREWLRSGIVPLDYPGEIATDYPELLAIVERKVKPERVTNNRENYRIYWWQYAERRPGLLRMLSDRNKVLVHPFTSSHLAFAFIPANTLVASPHNVFAFDTFGPFAILQSRVHEVWVRFLASSMKDDLRYTASDCFETFPFPRDFESNGALETNGRRYYERRAQIMLKHAKGLTALYNDFHKPAPEWPEIVDLRDLHNLIDRTVLGWPDIQAPCEYIPEFDDEVQEEVSGFPRPKKYRYRWPDATRDEVLARLLELNRTRAEEEAQSALSTSAAKSADNRAKKSIKKAGIASPSLFVLQEPAE